MASLKSRINFNKLRNKKEKIKVRLKKQKGEDGLHKKKNKRKIWYTILSIITFLAILAVLTVILFGVYIIVKAPEFEESLLFNKDSTVIYDKNNEVIATLGMNAGEDTVEKRVKLSYDEIPEVMIDALIATEDSRFFQHNGVDLARFLKASFGQLLGRNAGGASTLTMQLSKNALTDTTDTGIAGIIRKFTDIYLSVFKIEKRYTKQDIIEMYLNSGYLGELSYGIEQASQVYFGKSAKDVSLSEAALLAGLFQAPSAYDPYINPENAEKRRNVVLSLMVRHGYITEEIAEVAKSIPVESMIKQSTTSSNPYQGYVDTVIEEVIEKYNVNPYQVPLEIYTYFDSEKQDVVNSIYNGESGYEFKDEKVQVGIAVVDNSNGALIAVGARRSDTGERSWNYATMNKRHPGSTIKPILDYGPAIEYLNWSTAQPLFDEPIEYSQGGIMNNWDSENIGLTTLKKCLGDSINTCALQAFRATTNSQKWKFATSLGITPGNENGYIYEASSIGAFEGTNPKELAGAYSAFANGGYYTEPHTIIKIVYKESGDDEEISYTRERVMKETTAFLITDILQTVTPSSAYVYGTQIATKTGTSSYDDATLRSRGISTAVIQDAWTATYNPEYTITLWYGYDDLDKEYNMVMLTGSTERRKLQSILTKGIMVGGSNFTVPKGVVQKEIELETIPVRLTSEYTPQDLRQTHYFITGTEPTETSTRFSQLPNATHLSIVENGKKATLTWDAVTTPSWIDTDYLTTYFNSNYGQWAEKYLELRTNYNNDTLGPVGYDVYLRSGENLTFVGSTTDTTFEISDTTNYDSVVVKTAYEKFKDNNSSGLEGTLTGSTTEFTIELIGIETNEGIYINPTFEVNDTIPDIGLSTIKFLVNNIDVTSTLSASDMSYTIKDCTGSCTKVTMVDKSKVSEYQIEYTVNYLGNTYTETRYLHIK